MLASGSRRRQFTKAFRRRVAGQPEQVEPGSAAVRLQGRANTGLRRRLAAPTSYRQRRLAFSSRRNLARRRARVGHRRGAARARLHHRRRHDAVRLHLRRRPTKPYSPETIAQILWYGASVGLIYLIVRRKGATWLSLGLRPLTLRPPNQFAGWIERDSHLHLACACPREPFSSRGASWSTASLLAYLAIVSALGLHALVPSKQIPEEGLPHPLHRRARKCRCHFCAPLERRSCSPSFSSVCARFSLS